MDPLYRYASDISYINRFWNYRDGEWLRYILPLFQHEYPTHPKSAEWCLKLDETYMYVNYRSGPKPKFKWIGGAIIENADMRSDYLWHMNLDGYDYDYDVESLNGHKVLVISIHDKKLGTIHLPLITKSPN